MSNFNLYGATHKTWDHVGNLTPNFEYSEAPRPHGEFRVADWLPVKRFDKHFEDYYVVSAGKVVAFDREGRVVPAGLKTAFAVESGDVLTYATADVTEATVDLGTGVACEAGAAYTRDELTTALIARGLLDAGEYAEDFISFPVGVAPYNYYQWCGGDGSNPASFKKHNYQMQNRVAILCKYVIEMPLRPASAVTDDLSDYTAISDSAIADWTPTKPSWFSSTALSLTTRYASRVSDGDDVVAVNLVNMALAKSVPVIPWTLPTGFTREVDSISSLSVAGDYFVDLEVGVILMYEADGDAAAVTTGDIVYYHYDSENSSDIATSSATFGGIAFATGSLKPGDFVRADLNSNFVKANVITDTEVETVTSEDPETSLSSDELAGLLNLCGKRQDEIIGQVLEMEDRPKDYLDRVRTAYANLGVLDQMPGSASGGLPSSLTYSSSANRVVRILLLR